MTNNKPIAEETLRRLAAIMSGNDAPGEIRALTVTAQSCVDRCKKLAREVELLKEQVAWHESGSRQYRQQFEAATAELQEYRKAHAKPFMYGIADIDDKPYFDEHCVAEDAASLEDEVNAQNEQCGEVFYRIVPLYMLPEGVTSERG